MQKNDQGVMGKNSDYDDVSSIFDQACGGQASAFENLGIST
jgi:hypothetical protein